MSVRIIEGTDGYKCLYDSETMTAFGPIFYDEDDMDDFLEWLPQDARTYSKEVLDQLAHEWREYVKERAFDQYDGGYEGDGHFADNH